VFYECDLGHKGYLSREDVKMAIVSLLGYKPSKVVHFILLVYLVNNKLLFMLVNVCIFETLMEIVSLGVNKKSLLICKEKIFLRYTCTLKIDFNFVHVIHGIVNL